MQACGLSCCPSRLSLRFTFTFYTLLAPGDLTYPDVSHPISPRGYRVSRRQGAQKKTDSTRSSILVYFFRSFILFRGISNIMDSVTSLNILMKPTFPQFFFFFYMYIFVMPSANATRVCQSIFSQVFAPWVYSRHFLYYF